MKYLIPENNSFDRTAQLSTASLSREQDGAIGIDGITLLGALPKYNELETDKPVHKQKEQSYSLPKGILIIVVAASCVIILLSRTKATLGIWIKIRHFLYVNRVMV